MKEILACSKKNCNCGAVHEYKDDLTALSNYSLKAAYTEHERRTEELGNRIISLEEYKRKPFVHFHQHTFYSILDGCGSIDNYIKLAHEYGHPAMAITDHGTVAGLFEFWKKCRAAGIKPIMGMEAYLNDNQGEFEEKKYEGGNSHQSILIKNPEGYVSLNKLVYRSFTEGFYRRGRIKTDWLKENANGLLLTTSCAVSKMSQLVKEGKEAEAEKYLQELLEAFRGNLIAELQLNEYEGQKVYNAFIIKMAKKYDLMPIITNDVHYAHKGDAELQDTLIAINQKSQVGKAFKLTTRNLYYASVADLHDFNKQFGYNYPESFINFCAENTLKAAEMCDFDLDTKTTKYPKYEVTSDVSDYFKTTNTRDITTKLATAKLKQKIKRYQEDEKTRLSDEKIKEYFDRLEYEIAIIDEREMLDYFLVNWEIIRDYRSKGYDVGPGRGCFRVGSRVKMEDKMFAPIETIKVGDRVIDAFGEPQKVLNVFEYDINEDIIELDFDNGKKIICTLDHEILTKNRGWVEAKDLTEEDDIVEV